MTRHDRITWPEPATPPAWGIYLAALTLALTTRNEHERQAAAHLVHQLGHELLPHRQPTRLRREPHGALGDLIRTVLEERLRPAPAHALQAA